MLNILLMIILIIILIIFIILALGLKIIIEYEKKDSKINGCLKILILKYIKVYSKDLSKSDDDDDDDESEDEEERDVKKTLDLIKASFNDITSYLKKLKNSTRFNEFNSHIIVGFSSFADTGEYIGYIWAILSVLNTIIPNSRLSAEPSFTGFKLDIKGNIEIEIKLLTILIPTIKLLLKPEIRALMKGVRNG